MTRLVDLTGQRHGRLVIRARAGTAPNGKATWFANCDCGSPELVVRGDHVRSGLTAACGCLHKKHDESGSGKHKSVEWVTWHAMNTRCYNRRGRNWKRYGGRGITVCAGWRRDYKAFLSIMGRRPSDEHSIDRIKNDLGYWCGVCTECESLGRDLNCRWATAKEQANNRTLPQKFTVDGVTLSVTEWARRIGVRPEAIFSRLGRGWSIDRAVREPMGVKVKLTPEQVAVIRKRCATGETQESVAGAFGVKRSTVGSIVQRRRW